MTKFNVSAAILSPEDKQREIHLTGRNAWALLELYKADAQGCTPIENPAPRWSGYVYNLRRLHGLEIETIHESHGGPFAGTHARYVLRSRVIIRNVGEVNRSEAA